MKPDAFQFAASGCTTPSSQPSGGHRQPKASEVPQTENPPDAAMLKTNQELGR
jgi:hypothetical protein